MKSLAQGHEPLGNQGTDAAEAQDINILKSVILAEMGLGVRMVQRHRTLENIQLQ